MSRDVEDSAYYTASDTKARMPLRWMAPEVFTSHKFGEASDVWSFGVTMVEVFTRAATPYKGWTNLIVLEQVKGGYILPCPPTCPAALYAEVVAPCFSQDPHDRPSFQALCSRLESMSKLDDGGLASVRWTNPLTENADSSGAGPKPIAPSVCEHDDSESKSTSRPPASESDAAHAAVDHSGRVRAQWTTSSPSMCGPSG